MISIDDEDTILKRLMGELGQPNSLTLYSRFKQFSNELRQSANKDVTAKDAEIARLNLAIGKVCEGWTLPHDARKVLETALWPTTAQVVQT